jgi:hypothetical protein
VVADDRLRWWFRAGRSLNDDVVPPKLKNATVQVLAPLWLQRHAGGWIDYRAIDCRLRPERTPCRGWNVKQERLYGSAGVACFVAGCAASPIRGVGQWNGERRCL